MLYTSYVTSLFPFNDNMELGIQVGHLAIKNHDVYL